MKFEKAFQKIDFFGKKVNLLIKGEQLMKTSLGSLLSILFSVLVFLILYLNIAELFNKSNPTSYQQTTVNKHHKSITLNQSSFFFKFNYSDVNTAYLNITNYFEFDITYYEYIYDYTNNNLVLQNTTIIPLNPCPSINGNDDYNLCLPSNLSLNLEGYWDQKVLKYFRLNFMTCNANLNKDCHNIDEILNFAGNNFLNLNFYFNQNSIQLTNYSNPIQQNIYITYKFITNQDKITNFMIQTENLVTDSGFLLEDLHTNSFFNIKELQTDTAAYGEDSRQIYMGSFYASNISVTTKRYYIKIQDIFAKVGGVSNVLFFIFKYLNLIFSKVKMNIEIMNSVYYNVEKIQIKDSFIQKSINEGTDIKSVLEIKSNPSSLLTKRKTHLSLNHEKTVMDVLNLNFKFHEYIKILFSNKKKTKNEKFIQYFSFKDKLEYNYDIINIIKRFEEFEILLNTIFNDEQLKIFKNIKPCLNKESLRNEIKSKLGSLNKNFFDKKVERKGPFQSNNYLN